MNDKNTISVLLIQPMKPPSVIEIDETLECMQEVIGNNLVEIMPFDEEIALVCNGDAKHKHLPLNRALYHENGEAMDTIAGDFFICGAPFNSARYESLPPHLVEKYTQHFKVPQIFIRKNGKIMPQSMP